MSRLGTAQQRLDSAIARVEAALNKWSGERGDGLGSLELSAALDSALKDNRHLKEVTGLVSSRLDVTIKRLEHLLED